MEKGFTKEERLKCLESRIIRCVDVNDSESLRELIESVNSAEQVLSASGDVDPTNQIDETSLKKVLGTALIDAAVKNSPGVMETLLELGAPVDYMDEFKHTPVLRASEYGHTEVVKLLCSRGCDTNISDSWTRTPIHWAAHSRHTEVVRELLAHGALPDPVDKNYLFTPLMLAARMGKTEIVRMLLRRSKEIVPDPNCLLCTSPPGTAKFIIEQLECANSEHELLGSDDKQVTTGENKGPPGPVYNHPRTDSNSDDLKSAEKKLENFSKNRAQSFEAVTLCGWHKNHPRAALLQRARDINHVDIHGENPVFDAARQCHWDIVHMLVDEGCDLNHVAKFRGIQTAPILIARNAKNAVEMLVNLVRLNCDLEISGSSHLCGQRNPPLERVTAFQLALLDGNILATKILAFGGANLNVPSSNNWLTAFAEKEDQDWVQDLLYNPRSLKDSCRVRIRRSLPVKPQSSIDSLPLPDSIKLFLTLPELTQFEQYFIKTSVA